MSTFTPDAFSLEGKPTLVTGAGSGIGRGIALGFAACGADVACLDLNLEAAQATADEIAAKGGRALAVSADTTDAEALAAAVGQAVEALGPIRAAVNSAGIAGATPAEDMAAADFRKVIDVNLTGVFLSAQAEARVMLAHGGGSIVNIASMSGTIANRGLTQAHYNSSKAGVVHLTKSLATEWARRGVRVNAISPGNTYTPMNTRPEIIERMEQYAGDTPLGRNAEVTDLVGPAVFLASDAAAYCTGVDLIVDGGYVCW
ncbi:SDR family oxidoreductase [Streptomyces violens]|uniref:SDR family oxidoreductase n=1 Tax=Streptomyces violens TaxID=66377 RepID=UPI0004C194A9|nr:SDR family oxidoreductase [Streptomyces violens]